MLKYRTNIKAMKKRHKLLLISWVIIIFFSYKATTDKPKHKGLDFPKSDRTQGMSLGFSFEKGEYRYHSSYNGKLDTSSKVYYKKKKVIEVDEMELLDMLEFIRD